MTTVSGPLQHEDSPAAVFSGSTLRLVWLNEKTAANLAGWPKTTEIHTKMEKPMPNNINKLTN
jgi:hypothetical protein